MLYSCQDKWVDKCVYFSGFWSWEELDTWVQITKTKSCSLVTTRKHLILKLNWMFLSSFLSHEQRFYCLPFLATLHQAETTSWQLEEVQRKIAIATQLTPSEKQWDIFARWYFTIWELWNTFFALSLILMPTCTHTHIHPSSHKNFSKSSVIKLHPSGRSLSLALPPRCAIRREDTMFPWKKIRPNTKPPDLDALAAVATASQSHYRLIKNVDSSTQGKSQPGDLDVYHKETLWGRCFFSW